MTVRRPRCTGSGPRAAPPTSARARARTRGAGGRPGPVEALCEAAAGAEGLLLVDDRRRAPRTALPGPFLLDPSGRAVPAGWLPDLGPELEVFARAAARVQRRSGPPGPLAVLGQWEPRYLQLAGRLEANLCRGGEPPFPVFRWTSERITRADVVSGLRLGLGLGIYFGHGRPRGWAGYHGLRARHLVEAGGEPLGAALLGDLPDGQPPPGRALVLRGRCHRRSCSSSGRRRGCRRSRGQHALDARPRRRASLGRVAARARPLRRFDPLGSLRPHTASSAIRSRSSPAQLTAPAGPNASSRPLPSWQRDRGRAARDRGRGRGARPGARSTSAERWPTRAWTR